MDRKELEKLSKEFLAQIFSLTKDHFKIDVEGLVIDHICWRCESQADYLAMEAILLGFGTLFHKSKHNGRLISLIELNTPISYKSHLIDLIELPAPKAGKRYPNGFEHAEFVAPDGMKKLKEKCPNLPWNIKNIDKDVNPDLKLTHDGITIKFHPYTLAHVVKNLE